MYVYIHRASGMRGVGCSTTGCLSGLLLRDIPPASIRVSTLTEYLREGQITGGNLSLSWALEIQKSRKV